MKLIKTLVALTASTFIAASAFGYDSLIIDQESLEPGVSIATCAIAEKHGRLQHKIELLDRSSDVIPAPRPGATCAQYISDLSKFGANVEVEPLPCEALLPGTDRYKMCMFVFISTHLP